MILNHLLSPPDDQITMTKLLSSF